MEEELKRLEYEKRIFNVQDYISTHLDEDLNLEKLAGISAFSPFHFHRIFKSITKETLYGFIQRIRLERSCMMLSSNHDLKITYIALKSGFSTPSSFSRAFRQQYSMSPSEYQKSKSSNNSKNGTVDSKTGKVKDSRDVYISDNELENIYIWRKEMKVRIEEFPAYRVAYMRQIGPYGPGNFQLMQRLKKWAVTRGLLDESSIIMGIAHDNPAVTAAEKCRYDCGIAISSDYKLEAEINENSMPGGKHAVFEIEHNTEAIARAWNEIFTVWLPESGFQIDDKPLFERYTGASVDVTIEPEKCEICVPVKSL